MWIRIILLLGAISFAFPAQAQRKKKRSDFFGGARDYTDYSNNALMFEFGPTYTFGGKTLSGESTPDSTGRYQKYDINPAGKWGAFFNIGMAHLKSRGISYIKKGDGGTEKKRIILMNYWDWGLGVKMLAGKEKHDFGLFTQSGNLFGKYDGERTFQNTYVSGRATAHKTFSKWKKFRFDIGLGANFDYRLSQSQSFIGGVSAAPQRSQKAFVAQIHGEAGVFFVLKKGWFLNVSAHMPVLGAYEWSNGSPRLYELSSRYWPILFKVKFMKRFKVKPKKGCAPVYKDPSDSKTD